jgi:hypothetical protein
MDAPAARPQLAWQPLTFRGVAAFASASFSRLFLVQLVFAVLSAAVVVWFVHRAWFPVISRAISELPVDAHIRAQRLTWNGDEPRTIAESRFLSIGVDLEHEGKARTPSHIQVELGERDVKLMSLLGYTVATYPANYRIDLTPGDAGPWWGAWTPPIMAMTAGATMAALFVSWSALATIYFLPLWLYAFFANRDLSLAGSWRLGGAALMPGALILCAGIVLYALGALDLPLLAVVMGLHFLGGWIYAWVAVWELPHPKEETASGVNPFANGREANSEKEKEFLGTKG